MPRFFINAVFLDVIKVRDNSHNVLNGDGFFGFYVIFYIISDINHRYFSTFKLGVAKQGINGPLKISNVAVYGVGEIVYDLW